MKELTKILVGVALLALTMQANAQKFMIGYGISVYTDLAFISAESSDIAGEDLDDLGISLATLSLEMKYNVHELNSDMAISVASSPALGLMSFTEGDGNIGHYRIPIMAQFDWGNLSTFESLKDFGVGIGIGYQFASYGIFGDQSALSANGLVSRLGFRYFNRNNAAREIAIKYEFPREVEQDIEIFNPVTNDIESVTTSYDLSSVSLSFILYFNY